MSPVALLRLQIRGEQDVFLLRQRGREVARAVGLDAQDQIRVAAALSDLGRIVLAGDTWVTVVFHLEPRTALGIDLEWLGGRLVPEGHTGWQSALRLMDEVHAQDEDSRRSIFLRKNLPPGLPPTHDGYFARLRAELAELSRGSALDELRAQNEELLITLDSLERKKDDLLRANQELEETNKGVVALYGELTAELEQTNRGVVALYGELEDRSAQLRDASAAKTRFWSNVSHELRTPVNSVIGLTRLLLAAGSDPLTDDQRHQIQLISDSGDTLSSLVNDLLDIAKAESGRLVPQWTRVDLTDLFAQLRGTLVPIIPAGSTVALRIQDPPHPGVLTTDETLLNRILRNLLSNGLKFTEHGEVRLTARHENGWWEFVVSDTGIGIPSHEQKRVFEEFHQVPNALQARSRGTGLGLPYARKLTELLGGDLALHSAPGQGTTVSIKMPPGPDVPGDTDAGEHVR
jgi:signal transduction histidine kinase